MKSTVISILVAGVLIGGAIMLSSGSSDDWQDSNVSIENGTQVITILAKGGYSPKLSAAKADMPTVLRVETRGTFDCTSGLSIRALNYQASLPPTGITEIPIPPQKAGTTIQGLCAMGMYNFKIAFK